MSAASELTVSTRTITGKTSHRLAYEGMIPAVLYGPDREAVSLAVNKHEFEMFTLAHGGGAGLVDLAIEGEKKPVAAIVREVQHDPVKGTIRHVDFLAVSAGKAIHAVIGLHLVNDPAGVKEGGVLAINVHEINVEAKPGDLPEAIEVDVSAMEIGDNIHISDVKAPKGVKILDDADEIVASVQAPRGEEIEAETEVVEPEVIGAKSEE